MSRQIGWNTSGSGGPPSGAAGGDLAGTYPNPEVDGLQGEPVAATAPSEGDVLTFTAGEWTPAAPAGGAPSGPASGDLTDSYPGPTVAGIQGVEVNVTPPTADQALVFDGVQWVPTQLGSAQITDPTFTTVALGLEALDALALTVGGKADSDSPTFTGNVDGDGATTFTVPTVAYPNSTTAAASTAFVTSGLATKVDASSGTATGLTLNGTTSVPAAQTLSVSGAVNMAGATSVSVPTVAFPDADTSAASTAFVSNNFAPQASPTFSGTISAASITATGTINLAGAGSVSVPTVAFPDSDTSAASTAFVSTNFAPIASPTFTGNPQAPTPVVGDNNGTIATTAFVQEALRNAVRLAAGGVNEKDDFISSTTTSGDLPWATSANGAGTSIGPANAVANGAIGYRSFTAGTAATGRAAYTRSELVSTQAAFVTPWLDGTLTLAFRIQIPVLPIVAPPTDFPVYSFSLGTGPAVASDHFVNGIGLRYARAVTDQWVLASRSAGADVASANTGIAPTAGAWQWLVIVMSGASATCYIGATYAAALAAGVRATITTVGAYSSMLSPLMKINNTAATGTSRVVLVDTYALDFNLTTPR